MWYLGGELAESDGVARSPEAQIEAAKKEVAQLLPWIDQSQTHWDTLRIDRAEPAQSNLVRPDNAFLADQERLLAGWPTTLALAPDFSDRVLAAMERDAIRPGTHDPLPALPQPEIARPAWEDMP